MSAPCVLAGWPAIADAGAARAGGKAAALARLARYGFAVPPGLCLPAEAHDAWIAASGLRPHLLACCRRGAADADAVAAIGPLVERLRATPVPAALQDAWSAAARAATGWVAGQPLAVRSSAPQEDSAAASFAGIHRSRLNVQGDAAFWDAVRDVWCSLWSPAAVAYRQRMGLAHDGAAMAVLVMPLVAARASGIAFTQDPSTGRPDRMLVHANWGLGESLVAGEARGDEFLLARSAVDHPVTQVERRIGDKRAARVPRPGGGTTLEPTAAGQQRVAVLADEQAARLGGLLHQAALALDWEHPAFDFEWAWDGERFWILQARPITAAARHTYAALQDQPEILTRGNTREVMPFALQPVDWSAIQAVAFPISEAAPRAGGLRVPPALPRLAMHDGHLYLNISLMQWEAWDAFGVSPADFNRMLGGHHGEIRVPEPAWRDRVRKSVHMLRYLVRSHGLRRQGRRQAAAMLKHSRALLQQALPEDDVALARLWRERQAWYAGQRGVHFMQGAAGGSMFRMVQLIEQHLPGEGHALASAMLAGGEPSVTARQNLELAALARVAQADPVARAWLQRQAAAGPDSGADWILLPADSAFRKAFADFLDRYGHRGTYESYNRHPRWRDAPGFLLRQLPGLMAVDTGARRDTGAAHKAFERARRALPRGRGLSLRLLGSMARQEFNDRELARSAVMSAIEPNRRLLLALGARWVSRGWTDRDDGPFYLTWPELLAVLDGVRDGGGLRALLEDRRRAFERQCARNDLPDVWPQPAGATAAAGPAAPFPAPFPAPRSAGGHEVLRGVCVGRGRATGRACKLRSPEEGARLQPGEILVVPSTDPSWTPLFLKVGALVMETGGFLSHGAIVAREFGIPAVVNVPGIVDRVREGQPLHVDAARAEVTLLEPEPPAPGAVQGR